MNNRPLYAGHRERLKGKYRASGIAGWADYEVLEFALTFSISRRDTKGIAKELLSRFGSIAGVLNADEHSLCTVKGLSLHTALFLRFLKDLSARYLKDGLAGRDLLSSPAAVVDYCRALLKGSPEEEFHAFFLDTGNRLIAAEILQAGTVNRSTVYPRKVAERALARRASGVIIVHNHPGGTLAPSPEDIRATEAVRSALEAVETALLDHIIIAGNGYFSWKERGIL